MLTSQYSDDMYYAFKGAYTAGGVTNDKTESGPNDNLSVFFCHTHNKYCCIDMNFRGDRSGSCRGITSYFARLHRLEVKDISILEL